MWNNLSLHVPIWIGFFVFGWKFGGGGSIPVDTPEEIIEVAEIVIDLAWEHCGKYGLIYWAPEEVPGFYDCKKPE